MIPKMNISCSQALCWAGLALIAYYPPADVFIEEMGLRYPFLMLAAGAGSNLAQPLLDRWGKGGKP